MEAFSKFIVRFTIFFTAIYFLSVAIIAFVLDESYFNDMYVVLLELCLFLFCSVQGNYHCRYAKYTALGILLSDTITRLDGMFDFLSVGVACLIPVFVLSTALITTSTLAIIHFIKWKRNKITKTTIYEEYKIRNSEAK